MRSFNRAGRTIGLIIVAAAGWSGLAGPAPAAPKNFFFGTTVELKSEGLKFKAPGGAEAQILPLPTVYHYTSRDGRKLEKYAPRELWYASQYRGRWANAAGQGLILAVVEKSLPKEFPREHVLRAEYDAALSPATGPAADNAALRTWVGDFAGAAVKGAPRPLPDTIRLQKIMAFEFEGSKPARAGYVFGFKVNRPLRADPERIFFALFEWQDALPAADAVRAIEHDFLASVEPVGLAAPAGAPAARMQNKALAAAGERSAEFQHSREAVINSIKGLKDWWFVETENYVLVSDLPASQKGLVKQLQFDLEYLHAAYAQALPPRCPIEAVSVVRLFNQAADYNQYVGPEHSWSAGRWMPDKKELVIKPAAWGDKKERRETVAQTVYHEALHQYLFYAFGNLGQSAWYDEGHAAFFEGSQITKKGLEVDEVDYRRAVVEEMIARKRVELRQLFTMSYADFYGQGGEQGREEHYALAWGLVYYLRQGAPLEKGRPFASILNQYAETLWQTRDPEEATRLALEKVDLAELTAAFCDFWTSNSRRASARRHNILAP